MKLFYFIIYISLFCLSAFSSEPYSGEILKEKLKEESLAPLGTRCRIILLRHAETDWNALGKKQGWTDIPLNEKGINQAQNLGDKLSDLKVKTFYASALSRAVETAEILALSHEGAAVIPDSALRFFRQQERPWFDFLKSKKSKKMRMHKEIKEDSIAYFKTLSRNHPGETVIVVTHARVIKCLFMELTGRDRKQVSIKNGAIVRLLGDGETLSVEL